MAVPTVIAGQAMLMRTTVSVRHRLAVGGVNPN